jgi:hypothetical protein
MLQDVYILFVFTPLAVKWHYFLFSTASRTVLMPDIFRRIKWPEREAELTTPSPAEAKRFFDFLCTPSRGVA